MKLTAARTNRIVTYLTSDWSAPETLVCHWWKKLLKNMPGEKKLIKSCKLELSDCLKAFDIGGNFYRIMGVVTADICYCTRVMTW